MKINILLPYKEKFDENKASSVSITVRNNLSHTNFLSDIKVYGQKVETPLFKENFVGLKYSIFSLRSKNKFLANKMLKMISKEPDKEQLVEIHNRPYLINKLTNKMKSLPVSLFLHNDPHEMRGSKTIIERTRILNNCAAIFCVSKYIKEKFLFGVKEHHNKVHVLYNGVEKKLKNFPKKKKEILFVGRLVPEKGIELYVSVITSIAKRFPDWSFKIIGSYKLGENQLNSFAFKQIQNFERIGPQVKFYGFKDHNFVQKKMETASIVIIPSLWEEPFGLVAAEAMSFGTAIIASKVGGIPEIIKNNGILIENIDFLKLKVTLSRLMNDPIEMKLFQKKAWNNFTLSSESSSKQLDKFRRIIIKNYFI